MSPFIADDLPAPGRLQEDFVAYCRQIGEGQRAINTRLVWKNAIARLTDYGGEPIPFTRVTEDFLNGFRKYLLKDLKQNSAAVYFAKIKTAVRRAVRKHILQRNPADEISIATEETDRVHLTLPELRALEKTECDNEAVKDSFLFAAFSGLRYSDVKQLEWPNVTRKGSAGSLNSGK